MPSEESAAREEKQAADAISTPPDTTPPTTPPQPTTPPRPAAPPTPGGAGGVGAASSTQPVTEINIRVSRRLLWVGDAYYPLQNVSRVNTLTIQPRRGAVIGLFLKRLLLIAVLLIVLVLLATANDATGFTVLVVIAALAALAYCIAEMRKVLRSLQQHFVLTVETSGLSSAVVTSFNPAELKTLAHQIAEAIENPQAEFEVRVKTLTVNPKHYYFGDNVNMYGGTGNTGIAS